MLENEFEQDISTTTAYYRRMIYDSCKNHPSGVLNGYLVLDKHQNTISKKGRKKFSVLSGKRNNSIYGSVKCSESKTHSHSLTAMVIAYSVCNNLMEIFREYPFEKFKIEVETYPRYEYRNKRFRKYHKTGDDLTFLKADIEW